MNLRNYISKGIATIVAGVFVFAPLFVNFSSASSAYAEPLAASVTMPSPTNTGDLSKEKMTIYVGNGCPHCAKVEEYVSNNNYDDAFNIEYKEVYNDRDNAAQYNLETNRLEIPLKQRGVPLLVVGDKFFIGDEPIIDFLDKQYEFVQIAAGKTPDNGNSGENGSGSTPGQGAGLGYGPGGVLTIPMVVGAALVDAINPCEFAILIILMTTILAGGNRRKALWSGLAYSLAIFLSYLAMGFGLYTAVASAGVSTTFMKVIGILAIILGLLNLKDVFFRFGFKMEVPMSWRPKMKAIVQSATNPLGAFVIGLVISLFLLPCTSGPYIVILGMLGTQETFQTAAWLLLLYNLIFVSPMVFITLAIYKGFSVEKAEEIRQKKMKVMHFIAGLILLIMGVVLLVQFA